MGTQEVELERAGEKSAVDSSDLVCSFGGTVVPSSGVTIVTPIRNDPGCVRSPHANVWGWLVPNHLPTGKKAGIRSQIDLPN